MSYQDFIWVLTHLNARDEYMIGFGFVVGFWPTASRIVFALPRIIKDLL